VPLLVKVFAMTAARAVPRRKTLVQQTDAKTVLRSRVSKAARNSDDNFARPETAKKFCAIIRAGRFRFPLNLPGCRAF